MGKSSARTEVLVDRKETIQSSQAFSRSGVRVPVATGGQRSVPAHRPTSGRHGVVGARKRGSRESRQRENTETMRGERSPRI